MVKVYFFYISRSSFPSLTHFPLMSFISRLGVPCVTSKVFCFSNFSKRAHKISGNMQHSLPSEGRYILKMVVIRNRVYSKLPESTGWFFSLSYVRDGNRC
jgi:hypothetical protein